MIDGKVIFNMARIKKDDKEEEKSLLERLKEDLDKNVKGAHVSILSKSEISKIETYFSAPTYDLSRIISGSLFKGIPEKSAVLLVGPEASFKSSFIALALASAQKRGYLPVIIDTEGSWTEGFCERWGLDREEALYIYTPWISDVMLALGRIILNPSYEKLALVIDSIGGLERLKLLDDTEDGKIKADQGSLQKEIKRMLKMLINIAKSKKSIVFMSGHLYGNPSGYGSPEQLGGGFYLRLASDIIISLKKHTMKDDDKSIYGTQISAVTLKNRFYPPFSEASVEIDYQNGINKFAGLLDIALEAGLIKGAGAGWYTIERGIESIKFQGASKFDQYVDDKLLQDIEEYISTTGYSTINVNLAEAEQLIKEIEKPMEEEKNDFTSKTFTI